MIRFSCPGCRRVYEAPDNTAGGTTICPGCGAYIPIPAAPGGPGPSPVMAPPVPPPSRPGPPPRFPSPPVPPSPPAAPVRWPAPTPTASGGGSFGLVVLALLPLLASALTFLIGILKVVGYLAVTRMNQSRIGEYYLDLMQREIKPFRYVLLAEVILQGLLVLWLILGAIGMALVRPWGRRAILYASFLVLVVNIGGVAFMLGYARPAAERAAAIVKKELLEDHRDHPRGLQQSRPADDPEAALRNFETTLRDHEATLRGSLVAVICSCIVAGLGLVLFLVLLLPPVARAFRRRYA